MKFNDLTIPMFHPDKFLLYNNSYREFFGNKKLYELQTFYDVCCGIEPPPSWMLRMTRTSTVTDDSDWIAVVCEPANCTVEDAAFYADRAADYFFGVGNWH